METVHLIGLSGSLRKDSMNTKILKNCLELLPEDTSLQLVQYDDIPLYNADLDMPASAGRPAAVQKFRDELAKADGFVIVSPEYNYSIPGGLKNAIDWASRGEDSPLMGKAAAVMGATIGLWGTVRMQSAFHPVFQYLDIKPVHKPEIYIAQAQTKFNEHGELTDKTTRDLIHKKLVNLKKIILQYRK